MRYSYLTSQDFLYTLWLNMIYQNFSERYLKTIN